MLERERERETETETETERQTETDRQRQTDRDTETERELHSTAGFLTHALLISASSVPHCGDDGKEADRPHPLQPPTPAPAPAPTSPDTAGTSTSKGPFRQGEQSTDVSRTVKGCPGNCWPSVSTETRASSSLMNSPGCKSEKSTLRRRER